ncbi:MAG: zinc-dependent metalloprotease [Flavobacteriales bacterium]|nr:zinc-dependent metalloprotease [Flavobacteriales bacterium]
MKLLFTSLLSLALVAGSSSTANSQLFKKNKKKTVTKTPSKPKAAYKSIASVTKKCEKFDGLFPIYQDTTTGKMFIEISKEKLGEEFIHFSYVENGVMDAGAFKGSYRGSKIFKINKYYGNIEFTLENTNYYFNPDNEISKSSETNINKPIIISEKIAAKTGDNYLISASSLFLTESFSQIKPKYPPGYRGVRLGGLSKSKTKPLKIKNYPENTDVRSLYVYDNPSGSRRGSAAITSAQSISITYHHSLIAMPDNDFKPRRDDPRLGYFMTQVTDQTSASVTPYRDIIHRWNLVKKNPEAAMSEPVKPIIWWIENTTPKELRPIIKEGVEQWNLAFEKAGFKNAVVVNIQPDDADWDAGDIRYNVLRWTSTPAPPFGGYGPSFVNPRTGEILGADIMLEYVYILGRIRQEKMFEQAGLGIMETAEELLLDNHDHQTCMVGTMMQEDVFFGNTSMDLLDLTGVEKNRFLRESIQRLVLHEVGHTLGLNHNMKGSSIQSVEDLKNEAKMKQEGMCNSVMEYPSINFALNKNEQTYYYDDKPGLYDHWVIEYGYSQGLDDAEEEEKRLTKILARSTNPKLVFGNDADDMRSPGKGIDPMVNIYDLSNDPVAYGIDRIKLINEKLMPQLLTKYAKDNQSYMELRSSYLSLSGQKAIQLNIMTRQIGGVYVNRAFEGQATTTDPLTPVPYSKQKAAMDALTKYAFAPNVFEVDANLMRHLQAQRRGFGFFRSGEDPKISDRNLRTQSMLLAHLLHPNVLKRITDSEMYGNTYKLSEYMGDLTKAMFEADRKIAVSSARQNLQLLYTKYLIGYLGNKKTLLSTRSQVLYELNEILKISKESSSDVSTKAHKMHLKLIIESALKTD